jgi:hypothetical protein
MDSVICALSEYLWAYKLHRGMRRKPLEDPARRCRIGLQTDWKRRCRRKGGFHSEPFLDLLGMPWEQFSRHLGRQFKRRGWDRSDYGSEFTIDHRLPCCAFDLHKAEQRAMCSHWSNLQVLSLDENRRKNGSYSKAKRAAPFLRARRPWLVLDSAGPPLLRPHPSRYLIG